MPRRPCRPCRPCRAVVSARWLFSRGVDCVGAFDFSPFKSATFLSYERGNEAKSWIWYCLVLLKVLGQVLGEEFLFLTFGICDFHDYWLELQRSPKKKAPNIHGNSRILKWRYVSTIFLAIFWGYIPLHSNYIDLIYGRYLQFRFLKWPLTISNAEWGVFRSHAIVRRKGLQLSNCKQDQLGMFRLFSHEHGYFETHSSANLRKHQQLYLVAQAMRSHPRDDILGL